MVLEEMYVTATDCDSTKQSCMQIIHFRYLSRFFDCLAHTNLSATLATDKK